MTPPTPQLLREPLHLRQFSDAVSVPGFWGGRPVFPPPKAYLSLGLFLLCPIDFALPRSFSKFTLLRTWGEGIGKKQPKCPRVPHRAG